MKPSFFMFIVFSFLMCSETMAMQTTEEDQSSLRQRAVHSSAPIIDEIDADAPSPEKKSLTKQAAKVGIGAVRLSKDLLDLLVLGGLKLISWKIPGLKSCVETVSEELDAPDGQPQPRALRRAWNWWWETAGNLYTYVFGAQRA